MANQIKNLDKKIITSAKVEFLRAGYHGASLRQIALGAETSTASIYSRYNNKEGLFSATVEPTATMFLERIKKACIPQKAEVWTEQFQRDLWMGQIDFLYQHMDELLLLLTDSSHTKYNSYKETLAALAAQPICSRYAKKLDAKNVAKDVVIAIYVSIFTCLFEIILHRMQKEDATRYISRLCSYFSMGWQSVLL